MSPESSETASHWQRAVIVVLVLAVMWVPPLVRGTDSLKGSPTPLLRLNRGFDVPELKSRLVPPTGQPLVKPLTRQTAPLRALSAASVLREAIPGRPSARSPHVLRGPPALIR